MTLLFVNLRDLGLIMKTKRKVLKKRTVSISRIVTQFDQYRGLNADIKHRVISQDYQHQNLSLIQGL